MICRRTASLLTMLYLLTAATAYAECAWVLWGEDKDMLSSVWTVRSARRTRQECEADRVATYRSLNVSAPGAGLDVKQDARSMPVFLRFECLPDTVDPREPKGK